MLKRISKDRPKSVEVDSSKSEDVLSSDEPHGSFYVSENELTPTDFIFLEDEIIDQTEPQEPTYVTLDCDFLEDHNLWENAPVTMSFQEDINPPSNTFVERTENDDEQHVLHCSSEDQDGLIEMIESLLTD